MEAILKFDLDNEDDRQAHLRCVKSTDMAIVLFEVCRNLKKKMVVSTTPDDYAEGVNDTISQVMELMEDKNINIDEILS